MVDNMPQISVICAQLEVTMLFNELLVHIGEHSYNFRSLAFFFLSF
jgi:hypothetical protein